jgi:hypothetical protein
MFFFRSTPVNAANMQARIRNAHLSAMEEM